MTVSTELFRELTEPNFAALGRLTGDPAAFRAAPPAQPVVFRGGAGFTDLFGWGALDTVLSAGARRRPDFRVIRDNAQIPDRRYTRSTMMHPDVPDVRKTSDELAAGASLVMQGLQEYSEPIARFTRRLAHDLSRPVHANAYVTPPKSQGFKAHFDPRDSFVLQVEGTKVWTLREPVLNQPLAHENWERLQERPGWDTARLEAIEPWREVTLEPGDCLWLPRGWVHSACSEGVSSLHLTLSLTAWTEHWAVSQLLSRIVEVPGRAAFPADFVRDAGAATAAVAQLRSGLTAWFEETSDAELAGILQAAARSEFAVPLHQVSAVLADDALTPDTEFVVNTEAVLGAAQRGDRLALHLADRVVTLPAAAAPLIADLLGRNRFTLAELSPSVGEDVVRLLWREGIVATATATVTAVAER
ncbi:cupin domain-containing protein [Kitasatospora sp. GP82]|uniref:JmjC domain-containing protein n=1 Tax=Kitasatospora sp. GP82 TaxID=3035089 RepID=UPI0024747508|nr:cupin domain-containing protein [Kitasatospora sp. GP82]MDH6129998.1 lysine-specific demethylase/histidyl-hydroxylase NO66 [Kitasatospora sp. GP82]